MIARSNTLVNAMKAIKEVLFSSDLTEELGYFNTLHGWDLTKPKHVERATQAQVGIAELPFVILSASSDLPATYTATRRTYHNSGISLVLALGSSDVSDSCTQEELSEAAEIYADCIRRTLRKDVSKTDPNSILRDAGVFLVRDITTNLSLPSPGSDTNSNLVVMEMNMNISQLREGE